MSELIFKRINLSNSWFVYKLFSIVLIRDKYYDYHDDEYYYDDDEVDDDYYDYEDFSAKARQKSRRRHITNNGVDRQYGKTILNLLL